jgi:hypothetical protein
MIQGIESAIIMNNSQIQGHYIQVVIVIIIDVQDPRSKRSSEKHKAGS